MEKCIFCKIANNEEPYHKIWEDDKHLAFLSIFPNTPGFTVVITKKHYPSYGFELEESVYTNLFKAAKTVGKILDNGFEDVGRTGLLMEGYGVDHMHIKLFPMHGTKSNLWQQRKSNVNIFFKKYEGYISSHDYKRKDDQELATLAKQIREKNRLD